MNGPTADPGARPGSSFRRTLLRTLPVVAFLGLVALTGLDHWKRIGAFENWVRDLHFQIAPANTWDQVAVVLIDDASYARLFGETSPLHVDSLQLLIDAILAGRPGVLAVDIDTSDSTFRKLRIPDGAPPVIWAREASGSGLLPYLGRPDTTAAFGLVRFRTDGDDVIRRYRPAVKVGETFYWSLPVAMARAMGAPDEQPARMEHGKLGSRDGEELYIRYRERSGAGTFSATEIAALYRDSTRSGRGYLSGDGVLRGRPVLLGGSYRASRDRYDTPLGPRAGVFILAQVADTELREEPLPPLGAGVMIAVLVLFSVGLLFLFQLVSLRAALLLTLLGMGLLTAGAALFVEATRWVPYLVPVLILVLCYQLYAHLMRWGNAKIRGWRQRRREPSAR